MPAEVILPKQNPNDDAVEVLRWLVADGDQVSAGDDLLEVESTKAVTVIESPGPGYLRQLAAEGDVVPTGAPIALLFPSRDELAATAPAADPDETAPAETGPRFSAEGLRELRRLDLSADLFQGRGLVTGAMVRRTAEDLAHAGPSVRRTPIGPAKQTEIARLHAGGAALASSLTVAFGADALDRAPAEGDVPPLPLALIIHALAGALTEFPELNARFAGDHVEQYTDINVGVAVDAGHGLRVPVIKHADRLGPEQITLELLDLLAAYHDRGLHADDVAGATVTVSDLSGQNILQFQPRINQDQTLAVGVGADTSLPGRPMTLTAVFDHRVSSGRAVADFLTRVRARLLAGR
ncbi:2-oxo acid dehydrogenase subunit E2 [Micromonospora sp. NPDC051196]|uniref:2-oxo acid dehydrogenase subunit E2 n=1 Tax=Micromonospora sp. NPDC051196 TaxID=3155281 RepID=UPI003445CC8F